ncbi:MAG: helix-turn-helix domain-containing protein [Bacteroidales bacterium]|nr:helix-turn-helix domain-containing protein [Bacteroidales bacterium]
MRKDDKRYIPIPEDEFYFIQNHYEARFDYALHYHTDYELNLVFNTSGRRIINDSVETFHDIDLVLAGPGALHSWTDNTPKWEKSKARVVTLQFHNDFLSKEIMQRRPLEAVSRMLALSPRGIVFSKATARKFKSRLTGLSAIKGFYAFIEFLSILHELALSPRQRILSSEAYLTSLDSRKRDRLYVVFDHIHQYYHTDIKAETLASLANLSVSAFSHYFKKHAALTFVEYLISYRIHQALRMLADTGLNISEIVFRCGFQNISNFNRQFKKRVKCTPLEYREEGKHYLSTFQE